VGAVVASCSFTSRRPYLGRASDHQLDDSLRFILQLVGIVAPVMALVTYRRNVQTKRAEWLSALHAKFFESTNYKSDEACRPMEVRESRCVMQVVCIETLNSSGCCFDDAAIRCNSPTGAQGDFATNRKDEDGTRVRQKWCASDYDRVVAGYERRAGRCH